MSENENQNGKLELQKKLAAEKVDEIKNAILPELDDALIGLCSGWEGEAAECFKKKGGTLLGEIAQQLDKVNMLLI